MEAKENNTLLRAVEKGTVANVETVLKKPENRRNINSKFGPDNFGLLHIAVNRSLYENNIPLAIVKILVKNGVECDIKDIYGNNPLLHATKLGKLTFVSYFLEKCDPLSVNRYGLNILHIAAFNNRYEILKILPPEVLKKLINTRTERYNRFIVSIGKTIKLYKWTALHCAASECHFRCVKWLMHNKPNARINRNLRDAAGNTAGEFLRVHYDLLKEQFRDRANYCIAYTRTDRSKPAITSKQINYVIRNTDLKTQETPRKQAVLTGSGRNDKKQRPMNVARGKGDNPKGGTSHGDKTKQAPVKSLKDERKSGTHSARSTKGVYSKVKVGTKIEKGPAKSTKVSGASSKVDLNTKVSGHSAINVGKRSSTKSDTAEKEDKNTDKPDHNNTKIMSENIVHEFVMYLQQYRLDIPNISHLWSTLFHLENSRTHSENKPLTEGPHDTGASDTRTTPSTSSSSQGTSIHVKVVKVDQSTNTSRYPSPSKKTLPSSKTLIAGAEFTTPSDTITQTEITLCSIMTDYVSRHRRIHTELDECIQQITEEQEEIPEEERASHQVVFVDDTSVNQLDEDYEIEEDIIYSSDDDDYPDDYENDYDTYSESSAESVDHEDITEENDTIILQGVHSRATPTVRLASSLSHYSTVSRSFSVMDYPSDYALTEISEHFTTKELLKLATILGFGSRLRDIGPGKESSEKAFIMLDKYRANMDCSDRLKVKTSFSDVLSSCGKTELIALLDN